MKIPGSQRRETLVDAGYTFIGHGHNGEVILSDSCNRWERWIENDHHAGYTLDIEGIGYEFVSACVTNS